MDEIRSYKYIYFEKSSKDYPKRKTLIWSVRNFSTGDILGQVKWYAPWRQYCYFPVVQAVYSVGCLEDIADFIEKEMAKHKQAKVESE